MTEQNFDISYSATMRVLATAIGVGPARSRAVISPGTVRVGMGHAFATEIDRASIRSADRDSSRVSGWGVHGRRGRWLVNGSSRGLVRLEIDPPARARLLGRPITLRTLRVSLTDPDAFLAELEVPGGRGHRQA